MNKRTIGAVTALACAGAIALGGAGLCAAVPQEAAAATPAKVKIASVAGGYGEISVKVKKAKGAKGYQYRYQYAGNYRPQYEKSSKTAVTLGSRRLGEGTWKVRVRAWGKKGKKTVWGKWSSTRKCRVKDAEDAPAKEEATPTGASWSESTPGWKFPYDFKVKVLNFPTGEGFIFFLETDAPKSVMKDYDLYLYNKEVDDSWPHLSSAYRIQNNDNLVTYSCIMSTRNLGAKGWVSVPGGFLTSSDFVNSFAGRECDIGLVKTDMLAGTFILPIDLPHQHVGTITIHDAAARYRELAKRIVADACDPAKSKSEQMQQACDWIRSHSRYEDRRSDADGNDLGYAHLTGGSFDADNLFQYENGLTMFFDSASAPAFLEEIGQVLGYPVKSLYRDHSPLDPLHAYAQSIEDGSLYGACPYSDSSVPREASPFDPAQVTDWYQVFEP